MGCAEPESWPVRRMGYDTNQVSNDIGMSRQMIDHHMKFKDQMGIAADGEKHLKLITQEG
jgi:hypothetical protein